MIYYSSHDILSYKRLYNFIIGVRGHGKTYDTTRLAINTGLKSKKISFIVLTRYKEDIREIKDTWWVVVEELYKDYTFSSIGKLIYASNGIETFPIGEFVSLSSYVREKKKPRPYVKYIIFDECLNEDNDYLNNEIGKFLSVCDSVIRNRDNVRVILIANTISIINPYFDYFGIKENLTRRFTKGLHNSIIEFTDSEEFIKMRKNTKFGSSIEGTEYGKFAIDGAFMLDDMTNVIKKPNCVKHDLYNIMLDGININVSMVNNLLYLSYSKDYKRVIYTPYVENAKEFNAMFCDKSFKHFKQLQKYFLRNQIIYEDLKIKNSVILFMQFLMGNRYK